MYKEQIEYFRGNKQEIEKEKQRKREFLLLHACRHSVMQQMRTNLTVQKSNIKYTAMIYSFRCAP